MSSNNKTIIIRLRVDEATAKAIRTKANSHFNGNISACIRCATLQYDGEATPSSANSEIPALLTAILRQLKKIGTNVNQTTHQINERMKVSPTDCPPRISNRLYSSEMTCLPFGCILTKSKSKSVYDSQETWHGIRWRLPRCRI